MIKLLLYLSDKIKDCEAALKTTKQHDYWFGRLTAFKEIIKYLIRGGD